MEQTGSIYSVAPHASLTITCCSVLQACFPRTNIILIYNATKDKAGFLILTSDSVIISSIKTIMSFRLFSHFLFWFGTEKAQMSISMPWVTLFIFSFIKLGDPLENTSVVLKDFGTLDWTLWTGLAAAYNQCTATESVTVYQVIASCEMIMYWRQACGVITADHDIALSLNSNHPAFRISSEPTGCWEACQQNACMVHQHAPDIGLLYWKGVKNVK